MTAITRKVDQVKIPRKDWLDKLRVMALDELVDYGEMTTARRDELVDVRVGVSTLVNGDVVVLLDPPWDEDMPEIATGGTTAQ